MRQHPYRSLFAAVVGLSALDARAASLSELFDRVPSPPADVGTALSWVDNGRIVAPEYTALKRALDAERADIAALSEATPPTTTAPVVPESGEVPEVRGAILAYNEYLATHSGAQAPAAVLGKRTRWLQAAMGGRLGGLIKQMQPCPAPCNDAAIIAANQPFQAQKDRLAHQDLAQWGTLFADWKRGRSGLVSDAQVRIAATGDGAKAGGPSARSALARYRAAIIEEVEAALSITALAVNRAWAIEHGQPDAVSSSTRTARAAK